jgi:iron complex outermembrane receptor protein
VVSQTWNNVSPRFVIDQRIGADTMVYASVTRGYQAGGFNSLQVNGRYEPEDGDELRDRCQGPAAQRGPELQRGAVPLPASTTFSR